MSVSSTVISAAFLIPLAFIVSYYDICYRRIPNPFVLATLVVGFVVNVAFAGMNGVLNCLGGCALGFFLMFVLHMFGAMGAGDVKLFAAISAIAGANLVVPMFIVVTLTGGVLGVISILRTGQFRTRERCYEGSDQAQDQFICFKNHERTYQYFPAHCRAGPVGPQRFQCYGPDQREWIDASC